MTWARGNPIRASRGHGDPDYSVSSFTALEQALQAAGLPASLAEWRSLASENDLALFSLGALQFAQKLETLDRPDLAALLYRYLEQAAPPDLAAKALDALGVLQGKGNFGTTVECALRHFSDQVADPSALMAMALAGFAYRFTRLAALSRLGPGWAARLGASLAGFAAEVPTFTLSGRAFNQALGRTPLNGLPSLGDELAASALFLGSLKFTGALAASTQPFLPVEGQWTGAVQTLLPFTALFSGVVLGHRLEISAGLRAARNGGNALAEDLITTFQLQAAGSLNRFLLGKDWERWEASLDLRAEGQRDFPQSGFPKLRFAQALSADNPQPSLEKAMTGISLMVGREETPPPFNRVRELAARYLPLFPSDRQGYYSNAILQAACRISCSLPEFHERLIEALYQAPNRGRKEQLFTVLAIEDLFSADAMRTATGSFDYAVMQLLIGQTAAEENPSTRLRSFQKIFHAFELGLDRGELQNLILNLPYDETWAPPSQIRIPRAFVEKHREEIRQQWSKYRSKDVELLLHFVYQRSLTNAELASQMIQTLGEGRDKGLYLAVDIDAALDYARAHPLGNLVLQRLHDILATRDLNSKLTEIATDPGPTNTFDRIQALRRNEVSPEKIALQLNGTEHTGYLNDLRLARKVVSVMQEVGPYLENPKLRSEGRSQLVERFWQFMNSGRILQAEDLMDLLLLHENPATDDFYHAWQRGEVEVRIVAAQHFQDFVARWGQTQGKSYAMTVAKNGQQDRDLILIPELPRFDLRTPGGQDLAFHELVNRAKSLAHEAEHWRHFNGRYFGIEKPSQAIRLAGISRQERLVSEMMAYLEEFRWRVRFCDSDFYELAHRLGLTVPAYLRNIADYSYFGAGNQEKALP